MKSSFITRWSLLEIVRLGVGMVIVSILSIFFIDQKVTNWLNENLQGQLDGFARIITWFGLGDTYFLISIIGYLLARSFTGKAKKLIWLDRVAQTNKHFLFMLLCFFTSGILLLILKFTFGRARPYLTQNFESLNFQPFNLDWNYQSYPSGHTQVGFTLASFMSILFPKLSKLFFGFALLVGLSRVILEKHFLGDVIAGAYIGIIGTYIAWHWKGRKWFSALSD